MRAIRPELVLIVAFLASASQPASGQSPSASPPAETSAAIPAPTIPAPQPTTLPAPEPTAVSELDEHLAKLSGPDEAARRNAMADLADSDATILPAIAAKLVALRKTADRDGMAKLLEKSRKKGKASEPDDEPPADKNPDAGKRHHKEKPASEPTDKAPNASTTSACDHKLIDPSGNDALGAVLALSERDKPGYKDLVTVLALQRACVCIGTTAAAREIINGYTYFGDLFRIDVQRQLERMGDHAVPALIEAKYHDSRMVRTWAERRLDVLGKVIPGEAVRTADNQVLADILRAYGRAREVEAVRVIVTYANSDRLQVREAAREAIGQIGEPARWQLREAFENLTGRKAESGWDWKRIAIELFSAYDRARLSEVYSMADEGFARYKEGKLDEAIKSFDRVLARAPGFARKAEMAPAYLDQARALRDKDRVAARAALRRAELLDPNGPNVKSVQSEQALLDAEELAVRGLVDVSLLKRAVDLDPGNARARAALERAEHDTETRQASWRRYAAAVAIGVLALAAMLFIALAPRKKKGDADPGPRPPSGDAPAPPRQTADEPPPAFPDPPSRSERL
ncbi:MAG: hypothetical protein HY898_34465 [Deltaproteobacteria bacterium]|nr:hypothetical protein [Deltaproteobacteria bacterium]